MLGRWLGIGGCREFRAVFAENDRVAFERCFEYREAEFGGGVAAQVRPGRNDCQLGIGVFHEEFELVDRVGRVQRRSHGPRPYDSQEHDHELERVGENDRRGSTGLYAGACEQSGDALDFFVIAGVRKCRAARNDDRVVVR